MTTIIKDGTGTGYTTQVDSRGNLHVNSRTSYVHAFRTIEGNMFSVWSSNQNITTNPRRIFHLTYSEPAKILSVSSMIIYWNGGNTNFNRPAYVDVYIGETAPTTNTYQTVVVNQNLGSSSTLNATALIWNGVGDGMDGYVTGQSVGSIIVSQGINSVQYDGSYIISPGSLFGVAAYAEEDGIMNLSFSGYTLDPGVDY